MISRQSESFSFLMIERKEFVMSLLLARHKLRIFFFFSLPNYLKLISRISSILTDSPLAPFSPFGPWNWYVKEFIR